MEKFSIAIIGVGVVGLAIASKLSEEYSDIIVIEKNGSFGQETSSRNSEVIHSGIYYPKDYLRTQLCVSGNRMLYELCNKNNIPYKKIGKLIIVQNKTEENEINKLFLNAKENGVSNIEMISIDKIKSIEPNIIATSAIFAAETGIIDTHSLMKYYEHKAKSKDVMFAYNCEVVDLGKDNNNYRISIKDISHEITSIKAEIVINSAGLGSDKIAQMIGIDIDKENYRIYPNKGEYFSIISAKNNMISHLIYTCPLKKLKSLGIHAGMDLNGRLKFGPNEKDVKEIDYTVFEDDREEFFTAISAYLPSLQKEDLIPDMAGIRPKLKFINDKPNDFIIKEEKDKNLRNFINLIGIESPGLTAAPSIADYVLNIIKGRA